MKYFVRTFCIVFSLFAGIFLHGESIAAIGSATSDAVIGLPGYPKGRYTIIGNYTAYYISQGAPFVPYPYGFKITEEGDYLVQYSLVAVPNDVLLELLLHGPAPCLWMAANVSSDDNATPPKDLRGAVPLSLSYGNRNAAPPDTIESSSVVSGFGQIPMHLVAGQSVSLLVYAVTSKIDARLGLVPYAFINPFESVPLQISPVTLTIQKIG